MMEPHPTENPDGYFEHLGFYGLNLDIFALLGGCYFTDPPALEAGWSTRDEFGPLKERAKQLGAEFEGDEHWAWKDPRTVATVEFWNDVFPNSKYVFIFRNPLEGAMSVARRGIFIERHVPFQESVLNWDYYHGVMEQTVDLTQCLVISYAELMREPEQTLKSVLKALGVKASAAVVKSAASHVKPKLHRNVASDYLLERLPQFAGCLERYQRYQALSGETRESTSNSSDAGRPDVELVSCLMANELLVTSDRRRIITNKNAALNTIDNLTTERDRFAGERDRFLDEIGRLRTNNENLQSGVEKLQINTASMRKQLEISNDNLEWAKREFEAHNQWLKHELLTANTVIQASRERYERAENLLQRSMISRLARVAKRALRRGSRPAPSQKVGAEPTQSPSPEIVRPGAPRDARLFDISGGFWIKGDRSRPKIDAPVCIYQMGKVGSRSVLQDLFDAQLGVPVYHSHALANLDALEAEMRANLPLATTARDTGTLAGIEMSKKIRLVYDLWSGPRWYFISMVRDPIARNLSGFCQAPEERIPNFEERAKREEVTLEEMAEAFLSDEVTNQVPEVWWEYQFQPLTGVNVYETPFPRDEGYQVIDNDKVRLLTVRLEDFWKALGPSTETFVGIRCNPNRKVNASEEKQHSELFRRFIREVRLPEDYIEKQLGSHYSKHFYSDEELDAFRRRWLRLVG